MIHRHAWQKNLAEWQYGFLSVCLSDGREDDTVVVVAAAVGNRRTKTIYSGTA